MRFSKGTTLSRHVTEYVNSAGICCLQMRSQSAQRFGVGLFNSCQTLKNGEIMQM